jgi:mRNA interferase RelE/StbE
MERVIIQWTDTAYTQLKALPLKVRRGLLDKANELRHAGDPSSVHKRLVGPLSGFNRLCYSRYRAIYRVDRESLTSGDILQKITVVFVAVGIRKEGDKQDIYKFAQKLLRLGLLWDSSAKDDDEKSED